MKTIVAHLDEYTKGFEKVDEEKVLLAEKRHWKRNLVRQWKLCRRKRQHSTWKRQGSRFPSNLPFIWNNFRKEKRKGLGSIGKKILFEESGLGKDFTC